MHMVTGWWTLKCLFSNNNWNPGVNVVHLGLENTPRSTASRNALDWLVRLVVVTHTLDWLVRLLLLVSSNVTRRTALSPHVALWTIISPLLRRWGESLRSASQQDNTNIWASYCNSKSLSWDMNSSNCWKIPPRLYSTFLAWSFCRSPIGQRSYNLMCNMFLLYEISSV